MIVHSPVPTHLRAVAVRLVPLRSGLFRPQPAASAGQMWAVTSHVLEEFSKSPTRPTTFSFILKESDN